jgi:dGTPase
MADVALRNVHASLMAFEDERLSSAATRSAAATRIRPEEPSGVRTEFQRDRDRVIHAKSFRRLMHKTQVFIAPAGDHYRTRLTHTLEVTQVARTIGRALALNEDLIEAIGLAHDLGHTPFGHAGERALAEMLPGFRHNEQSLRVVDLLEKDGRGLNLTRQVRDGILNHSKGRVGITASAGLSPATLEGEVVKLSDGLAYINHDLDDALRAGLVGEGDVPPEVHEVLGTRHAARIDTLVRDVVAHSDTDTLPGAIRISDDVRAAADALRDFLFDRVYTPLNRRPDTRRAQHVVRTLFAHYAAAPEEIPAALRPPASNDPVERQVADFIATMTDRYAVELFERLYVPKFWSI